MTRRNKWTTTTNDKTVRCRPVLRVSCCEGWSGDQTLDTGRPCCRTRARGNRACWCPRNHADLSLSSSVHRATACTIQTPPHSVAVISKWYVVFNAIKQKISNEGFDIFLRQETQLPQKGRATLRVVKNLAFTQCHSRSLEITRFMHL